jgi:hypothetical protein
MYDQQTKTQFIELRSQGWSLARLSTQLRISKRTLVDWNHMFQSEISALRGVEIEALQEKLLASQEEQLSRLARHQKAIEAELADRNLKSISTENLFRLAALISRQIQEVRLQPALDCESPARLAGIRTPGPSFGQLAESSICPAPSTAASPSAAENSATPRLEVELAPSPPQETPLRCNFCPHGPPTLGASFEHCCREE